MSRVRMPADVEREDKILAGLTARQLVIIASPGLCLWLLYQVVGHLVAPLVLMYVDVLFLGAEVASVLYQRHVLRLNRLLLPVLHFIAIAKQLETNAGSAAPVPQWVVALAQH